MPSLRPTRSRWLVAAAVLALTVLGTQYWVQRESLPTLTDTAPTPSTARPATPSQQISSAESRPKPSIGVGATTVRTLAWAPVEGATGYEMQLFRGPRRVYVTRTTRPRLTLPESWRYGGRVIRLEAGRYRWKVWPLRGRAKRGDTAVVQAQILIAPR